MHKNHLAVFILSFLFLIGDMTGISQSSVIDSLKSNLSHSSDSSKSQILLSIAMQYRIVNYDSVEFYGNIALDNALLFNDDEMVIKALIDLAHINITIGNNKRAILLYNRAKYLSIEKDKQYLLAKIYIELGRYYAAFSNYAGILGSLDSALTIINSHDFTHLKPIVYKDIAYLYLSIQDFQLATYYSKLAINSSIQSNDKKFIVDNLLLIGKIFFQKNNQDSTLFYFHKALAIAKKANDKRLKGKAYRQIASWYIETANYNKSIVYIDSAIACCNEIGFTNELASLITFKGHISSLKKDYNSTVKYNLQALELRRRTGHIASMCASLINIGSNYTELKEFKKAHFYLNQGIEIAEDQQNFHYLVYGYDKLSRLNVLEGNYKKALHFNELKALYNDSIITNKTNEKIMFLRHQVELERENTRIEKLNLDKKTTGTIFLIIIIILLIGVIILLGRINYLKKQAEHKLKAALAKAKESDNLKSAFLANMSHEIRTPMNGILGFANLLRDRNVNNEEQAEYVEIINKSGERMLNIINNLIDISTIEAGQTKVLITKVDVNKQLNTLFAFFLPQAEKKGLKLLLNIPEKCNDILIDTDKEKFHAILTNLIMNAIKYSNTGTIELGYEKKKNELEFFVIDNGIGIAENKKKVIFNRFVQEDNSLSSSYEGAGLGLSIAKAYIDLLNGKIWVKSEKNIGSQFYFTLPYNDEVENEKAPISVISKPDKITSLNNLIVLIVEDDKISESYLSIILKGISEEMLYARTAVKAVNLVRENKKIDLVLMDIQLPEMNGYEATREIRKFNKEVIIIAQTAFAIEGDREKALQAGCNDYISKPIQKEMILDMIDNYLGGK